MKLIVWLGNPWKDYAKHRHTIGFVIVDRLVNDWWWSWSVKNDWWVAVAECLVDGQKIILAKPLLYMNRSWWPVQHLAHFYKIEPKDILVIHDEIDFPVAKITLKLWGRSWWHNGLKDIIAKLWTQDFWRLRIGVGRPGVDSQQSVADYVLENFRQSDLDALIDVDSHIVNWVQSFLAI
jgi:PTH1 family peptidyl-tRNA hydrolase